MTEWWSLGPAGDWDDTGVAGDWVDKPGGLCGREDDVSAAGIPFRLIDVAEGSDWREGDSDGGGCVWEGDGSAVGFSLRFVDLAGGSDCREGDSDEDIGCGCEWEVDNFPG